MDDKLFIDVDYKQTRSNGLVSVSRKTLFKFFYSTTYAPRSGKPFTINSIIGPISKYDLENVDVNDVVSVTLINPRLDERPFVMWLEKADGITIYYGIKDRMNQKWEPIDDLNEASYEIREKMLLYSIKNMFSLFFATEIKIDHTGLKLLHDPSDHKIVFASFPINGLVSFHYKPKTVHSISKIYIDGKVLDLDGDMRFVKDFNIYYTSYDTTTPFVIETFDYEIGDELPLYNYYKPTSIDGNSWIGVECWTKLTKSKCKSELELLLKQIFIEYKKNPITLIINITNTIDSFKRVERFSGVPFTFEYHLSHSLACQGYKPIIGQSFFVKNVFIDSVEQKIDIRSRELSSIYVFHLIEKINQPVLFCFVSHIPSSCKKPIYIWYKLESLDGNEWTRLEFDASPNDDHQIIDQKIRDLYMPGINLGILLPSFWFIVFSCGVILGTLVGINYSRRIIGSTMRLYRYLRR